MSHQTLLRHMISVTLITLPLVGCGAPTVAPTPAVVVGTATLKTTPTPVALTATLMPTRTPTNSVTHRPSLTPTKTPIATPTNSVTPRPSPTSTKTLTPTPTPFYCGSGSTYIIEIKPPRTIREIRLDLKKRASQWGFSLWEVEIYGPGTGNLAIGAIARASSSQNSYGCYGCFPDKAIDGNMDTRWGSEWYEPQWLKITLPAPQVVNRVVLKWEVASAKEYCMTVVE
jgi:hypothetical protein